MHYVQLGSWFCGAVELMSGAHLTTSYPRRPPMGAYAATIPLGRRIPVLSGAGAPAALRNVDETILP